MQEHGFDHIDILKLDCEGSEYSILGQSPSLGSIGLIIGEKLMGVPGMILSPVVLNYVRVEMSKIACGSPVPHPGQPPVERIERAS